MDGKEHILPSFFVQFADYSMERINLLLVTSHWTHSFCLTFYFYSIRCVLFAFLRIYVSISITKDTFITFYC